MGKQDYLQDLIRSLSKPEKRHFKLFTARYKREGGKKYLGIFEALEKERSAESLGQNYRESDLRNLAADKHYLSEMLLASLRQLHAESSVAMCIANELLAAHILRRKALFTHALSKLARARKEAVRYEQCELVVQAIQMEMEIRGSFSSIWPEPVQELTEEMNRWLQHRIFLNSLEQQRIDQLRLAVEKGRPLSGEDRQAWQKRLAYFDPEVSVTGLATEKSIRLRAYSHILFVLQDIEASHKINMLHYGLYRSKPELAETRPVDFLAFLFRYSSTSIQTGNYSLAASLLAEIRAVRSKEESGSLSETAQFIDERLLSTELFLFGKSKRFDKMRAKEKEVVEFIRENKSSQQVVIGFNMSTAFMFSAEWRKVISWTHYTLNYPSAKKNYILFVAAGLHQLIAYIAMDDFEAAQSRAGALRRYVQQRQAEQSSVDTELIRMLIRIATVTDQDSRAQIASEFLGEWGSNEFFVQTSEYIAVRNWIEGLVQG